VLKFAKTKVLRLFTVMHHGAMRRSILVTAVLATLVVGCKSGPVEHLKDAGPATLPGGWSSMESKEDGLSIGLPNGWKEGVGRQADLQSMGLNTDSFGGESSDPNNPMNQMMENFNQQNALDEAKAMEALRKKGILLHAVDSSRPVIGEERTRFYVKRIEHDSPYPLEEAAADEKEHLTSEGPAKNVQLPVGKAVQFVSNEKTRGGDEVTRVSYVLADGKLSYVIRFVATNNPSAVTSIEKQVAETFRAKPTK
jgi:hypothetical protein